MLCGAVADPEILHKRHWTLTINTLKMLKKNISTDVPFTTFVKMKKKKKKKKVKNQTNFQLITYNANLKNQQQICVKIFIYTKKMCVMFSRLKMWSLYN